MKRLLLSAVVACLVIAQGFTPFASVSAASNSYAALGDSVAAGAGLSLNSGLYGEDQLCDRSISAYPHSFAASTGLSLQHLACSGAEVDQGIYDSQELGGTEIPEQLETAFQQGTPEVISMTVGANDVRWTQFIRECLSGIGCDNRASTTAFNGLLFDLRAELNWAMFRIHHLSDGNRPHVLLNGYYMPYSGYTCNDAPQLTANEYRWINQRVDSLNRALERLAGRYTYVHYVPVDFSDHGLCSADPWVQGLQDNAPFHPTAAGQEAIANANLEAYRELQVAPDQEPYSLRERLMGLFSRMTE